MPGTIKYGQSDVRNILERASARETAARVAAGSVAKHFLREFGIEVHSHIICIGGIWADYDHPVDWARVIESPVQCVDPEAEAEMIKLIDKAKEDGDTVGGMVEVVATGVPIGLGSHVHYERKLDARIALALMSIQACKGGGHRQRVGRPPSCWDPSTTTSCSPSRPTATRRSVHTPAPAAPGIATPTAPAAPRAA